MVTMIQYSVAHWKTLAEHMYVDVLVAVSPQQRSHGLGQPMHGAHQKSVSRDRQPAEDGEPSPRWQRLLRDLIASPLQAVDEANLLLDLAARPMSKQWSGELIDTLGRVQTESVSRHPVQRRLPSATTNTVDHQCSPNIIVVKTTKKNK